MNFFKWDKPYELGIEQVDSEHHGLVDLINGLADSFSEDKNDYKAEDLLNALTEYADQHFKHEEELMRTYLDKRHIVSHRAIHQQFIDDVLRMKKEWQQRSPSLTPEYLLTFLTNWLSFHILVTDRNMANQIKEVKSGVSPEIAYDEQEKHYDPTTKPLIQAVNALFSQLSNSNKKLRELNEKLEQKVKERTVALDHANEELKALSLTDMLTQLPNRRHALQQLQRHWDESEQKNLPLACMMIDADYFKIVNDQSGHDAGDRVLITLARELEHAVRNDDFVSRLGGDEFFIICPDTSIKGAKILAQQILDKVVSIRHRIPDLQWNSSVSIGIACKDNVQESINDLIKAADQSVYHAKEAGRGCVKTCQTRI